MKILCFIVIGIAFLIFYQNNPTIALILIVVAVGGYLLFKVKGKSKGKGMFKNLMRNVTPNGNNNVDKVLTYLILERYLTSSDKVPQESQSNSKKQKIEQQKQKVLNLLRE
ncbi:MAG: hypothetical protein P8Y97_20315 [Candidatus Lokiarchaeota archaeon]